ncbi:MULTISPECIES: lysophospholipid transporter LplT [Variovorax]|uniref:lysophospholipid transporter LplT n=1 Tax=Variovorax TaxID=34072 RepID=UPI00086E5D59|nr:MULTISPECIES: lysophospholipid transporter LplT [Variovorax]MBN8752910.1 lysophospholipid transporter LplT [Variovorax sp.]ODU16829.1 MAG: lysophospholipid transporter LplT [Variovorax sp. SCN 67-85]ODV25727.1 MAG: lysophospholipid transporter LplT [Variovorax sp. SCN 67-20]OJZ15300.1 MAG: lysophospholipid transporter LplT [Variovorax sp. 67-131]UKI08046.1 lysophospholipid transporter LplT [Variovorax paradoxus]
MRLAARSRRALASVVAAQFLSSLADNALLIVAIDLLMQRHAPGWMTPALRLFFYLSYVLLAAFAGAAADAAPKGRVLMATNLVKLCGCGLLLWHVQPLLAYTLVGLGAAAYSPAKYGILPELLPQDALVGANGWVEATTVLSILFGVALGSTLVGSKQALMAIGAVYLLAAACTLAIPHSPARNRAALAHPGVLLRDFSHSLALLWRDPDARISLAVTSLFWAASATLQFLVLRFAAERLGLTLSQGALLQIAVALGMAMGALGASRWFPLPRALRALPLGIVLGAVVLLMTLVTHLVVAAVLLVVIGAFAGLLLVPMNALLQSRGLLRMNPGQSIAVQNFNESLASLAMLGVYGALIYFDAPLLPTLAGFGGFLVLAMGGITVWSRRLGPARAALAAQNV